MSRSSADFNGLPADSTGRSNNAYLYGLSDFWQIVFEDKDLVNDILECTTIQLADIYSRFLQLTSTISLSSIQEAVHSEVKLVLFSEDSLLDSATNTYQLPLEIKNARYLCNRPMVPTMTMTEGVHYDIDTSNWTIRFHKPLNELPIPRRVVLNELNEQVTQFALWFTDVIVEEHLIYNHFGRFVISDPESAISLYKDFVSGLFYLFTQGPTLDNMAKGFCLSLGIPLARATETVISDSTVNDAGNFLVITESNLYEVPYGLSPSVSVGDTLEFGQPLANIATVDDYRSKNEWWLDIAVPASLFNGSSTEYVTLVSGSPEEQVMREYLKNHIFLVKLSLVEGLDIGGFERITQVFERAKPSYTMAIYVLQIEVNDDIHDLTDDNGFSLDIDIVFRETLNRPEYINRYSNDPDAVVLEYPRNRDDATFIRYNYNETDGFNGRDTVVPDVRVPAANIFRVSGSAFPTGFSAPMIKLSPIYNIEEAELRTKMLAMGLSAPFPLPNAILITGFGSSDYNTFMFRGLPQASTPGREILYDEGLPATAEGTRYGSEALHGYIHSQATMLSAGFSTFSLYASRMTDGIFSLFLHHSSYSQPAPKWLDPRTEEQFEITQIPSGISTSCVVTLSTVPGFLTPDISGQTVSKTTTTAAGGDEQYAAYDGFSAFWASGVRFVEGACTAFTATPGSSQASIALATETGQTVILGYIGSSTWVGALIVSGTTTATTSFSGGMSSKPALGVDPVTRDVIAYLDGVQLVTGIFTPVIGAAAGWLTGTSIAAAAALAFQSNGTISMDLVTDSASMSYPYAGDDWCGNTISSGGSGTGYGSSYGTGYGA